MEMISPGRRSIFSASTATGTGFDQSSDVNEGDTNGGTALLPSYRRTSFTNPRSFDSAPLPQRSNTFPPVGQAAASYGGTTDYISTEMASIAANGQERTRENGSLPSNSRPSTENMSRTSSTSRLLGQFSCLCTFPWTHTTPSNAAACPGPEHFKVRHLSRAEKYHLEKPLSDPYLQKLSCSRVFEGPLDRLKVWPRFFPTTEASGIELRDGFVTLWTTCILAESVLAAVAIQPFVSNPGNLTGLKFTIYGLVWMLALIIDFLSLAVTALFLGYLHGSPPKLTYMWVCNIGAWIGVPAVLVLLATFVSLGAIAYTSWAVYGQTLGIVCTIIEVLVVIFAIATSTSLEKACKAAEDLD